jgi:hypothetical protein
MVDDKKVLLIGLEKFVGNLFYAPGGPATIASAPAAGAL